MQVNQSIVGLSGSQVEESRLKYGVNVITPPQKKSFLLLFFEKFSDPLIIILLVAGILSVGISCYEYWTIGRGANVFFEPLGIFIAILLATGLGFIFEMKAAKEFAILNKVNDDEPVQVIRDGRTTEIPRKDVVVGDIVVINTGMEVPADGDLLEAMSLSVDESSLTGEPFAHKTVNPEEFDPEATYAGNRLLKGTNVMEGHGIMRVTAVGDATENGKVSEAAQIDDSVKTPLNEQLERLGTLISRIAYVFGILVLVFRPMVYFSGLDSNIDWLDFGTFTLETIMIAVTLVVVSVPEGLPMAVTLSLAYSMRRMLKTNNLVRKIHACETMGATTVICTDKTGTLTQNKMQVREIKIFPEHPSAEESFLLFENMAVNSTADLDFTDQQAEPSGIGNPTEVALILYLHDRGTDYLNLRQNVDRIAEIPFTTEKKYMATEAINSDGKEFLFIKGAPEIIYGLCSVKPPKEDIDNMLLAFQKQAMRTLGFAYAVKDGRNYIDDGELHAHDLTFQAVAAISDPIRDDVPAAVAQAVNAGINVKIVTGDTPGTAKEIGRQVGLWNDNIDTEDNIITGPQFEALTDAEVKERAKNIKIIARARPLDKKRLVETLQEVGEVVAVTGDGTNDAPALKAAHVGLSMGDGTAVAKEASDITILDNSFSSIGRAVMWGRSLYQNIRRFIIFQMTVNVVACLIVVAGAMLGTESPLTVTQMLWVNLIMDTFAAMALAALPPSPAVMKDKPRDQRLFIIDRGMWNFILGMGVTLFIVLLGLLIVFENIDITGLYDFSGLRWGVGKGLSAYELSLFFTIFVFLQFWNMFNARAYATGKSALDLKNCGEFVLIAAIIFIGQVLIIEIGEEFFNVVPLKILDWVIIVVSSSLVLWTGELIRWIKKRRKN